MFERVYTVTDYHDGPRQGIADYRGHPHAYDCEWSEPADEFLETYRLMRLDERTFKLAMEAWSIWCRWHSAWRAGSADLASHPALPQDRARHDELQRALSSRLGTLRATSIRARGAFRERTRSAGADAAPKDFDVEWTEVVS